MNAPKPPTPMLPTRGARLEIRAEGLTPEGDAFAHLGDVELRVPGLLPGERAEVLVTEDKARRGTRRARVRLLELREPSPARREPACRHQRRCGGCPLMILDEAEQRAQKRAWLARLGLEVAELRHDDAATGYRWSAKRVVGGSAGALELGSWVRGSHELASMSGCLVDHPTLVAAASEITEVASRLAIEPYDEAKASG
ncbi:MAG: TRAM domain-containing protein, partial [Myxococcales bacterium]|nr:TRAM domain-containing protein [Myxococcales bacterium]